MTLRHVLRSLVVVASSTLGCDPTAALTQTPLFAALRDDLLAECCNCLSEKWFLPEPDAETCPDVSPGAPSRCLCEGDAASCRQALSEELTVTLIGACVYDEPNFDGGAVDPGPCADACRGVLAYP